MPLVAVRGFEALGCDLGGVDTPKFRRSGYSQPASMSGDISSFLGPGGSDWNLPPDEGKRQAIASLRGYAYQIHRSLSAWIALPPGVTLHLEVAEDYATVAADPLSLQDVLAATQVKDTRESGSVTLNSADVLSAIQHLWELQEANPGRSVRLEFLSTSPIGKERKNPLIGGEAGLSAWRRAARGGQLDEVRLALATRFTAGGLATFVATATDDELRQRLIAPLTWTCGARDIVDIEADNRVALIELAHTVGGTPELSARAADTLLGFVLSTILQSADRRLTRADLLVKLEAAITVRLPAQTAMTALAARPSGVDLVATGAWGPLNLGPRDAPRDSAVAGLKNAVSRTGRLWLHGSTGLGKTTLANLLARNVGGDWRVLALRGASAATASERVIAARNALVAFPGIAGVIVDDIAPEHEQMLETAMTALQRTLDQSGALCIVTSRNPPGRRLARAIGIEHAEVCVAPSFTPDDAGELVGAYGGDGARWAWFTWAVGGMGHPQLVDVVVAGLAARHWPEDEMRRWMRSDFQNEDVEAERDSARRRLLAELEPDTLKLLARVCRIVGRFDRELALASGQLEPAIASAPTSFDRLMGHWIERAGPERFRTSPLVEGLDRQVLSEAELVLLDRQLALSILSRTSSHPDIVDIAFAHAVKARAIDLVTAIANNVIRAEGELRPYLASAMPIFREADADLGGLLADWPFVALMVRLAQHRLVAAISDSKAFAASAVSLLNRADRLQSDAKPSMTDGMVLTTLLLDNYGFGKVPGWFGLLRKLDTLTTKEHVFADLARSSTAASGGKNPIDFMFIAHAVHLPGLEALDSLFEDLDTLETPDRDRWLASLGLEPEGLSMLVDNAWLKQAERGDMDGRTEAGAYRKFGETALRWGAMKLAGKCFRAEAIMLDEYAKDKASALDALARVNQILPDNLDLARERAKISWRSNDYAGALHELSAIADQLAETTSLDVAFAFREGGASAGELGRWSEAQEFFVRAGIAARAGDGGKASPFAIGLAADAAAAQCAAGDMLGGMRAMAMVIDELSGLPEDRDLAARACHAIVRHIVLWIQSLTEPDLTIDGEAIRYVPGCASNPSPHKALQTHPLGQLVTAWAMLGRIALEAGVLPQEVLGWPGVPAVDQYPALAVVFRMALLRSAIERASMDDFARFLIPAMEGYAHIAAQGWNLTPPDPINPLQGTIPAIRVLGPVDSACAQRLKAAAVAMALSLIMKKHNSATDLEAVREIVNRAADAEVVPEWSSRPKSNEDLLDTVAHSVRELRDGNLLSVDDMFMMHLRLFEWLYRSDYVPSLIKPFADRVADDWQIAISERIALLRYPRTTVPMLKAILTDSVRNTEFVAEVLLAAEPCTGVNLSRDYRSLLRKQATPNKSEPPR